MSRIASHVAIAAIALPAGALGAAALAPRERREEPPIVRRLAAPERVRTVVETRTIHRVRHVHVHRAPSATAAPAAPVAAPAAAPPVPTAPVVRAPAVPVQQPAVPLRTRTSGASHTVVPSAPLRTRTSGAAGGSGEHEAEHESAHGDD